jgi:hypothetical protein
MQVTYDDKILYKNLEVIRRKVKNPAFMVKKEFLNQVWVEYLRAERMYSNIDGVYWDNIYWHKDYTIIDAFDQREGISMEQARRQINKNVAVVNFYCCNGKIPTLLDLDSIYETLRHYGYKRISFGGSMIMFYDFDKAETRIGEVLYTGWCDAFKKMYPECQSPYTMYLDIAKETDKTYVVNTGSKYLAGFSNATPVCINTDVSVYDKKNATIQDGKLVLHPDYYTLIKLAWHGKI